MASFAKQSFEAFTIRAEFKNNIAPTEFLSSAVVTAIDTKGSDVSATILDNMVKNNTNVTVLVQNGEASSSPYTITFRVTTSISHKWEMDVVMRVIEE